MHCIVFIFCLFLDVASIFHSYFIRILTGHLGRIVLNFNETSLLNLNKNTTHPTGGVTEEGNRAAVMWKMFIQSMLDWRMTTM